MDFYDLIKTAESVKQRNAEETMYKRYSTSVSNPKKLPKKTVDDNAVKKFLARKQEEEKRKEQKILLEKQKLFALKCKDAESVKKYHKILKRNKTERVHFGECLDKKASDGVADVDDDYGYVSKESSDLHNKLLSFLSKSDKKNKLLIESTLSKINHDNDRMGKHREAPQQQDVNTSGKCSGNSHSKSDIKIAPQKKKPPPSNLSFNELLKLAQQKQHEPIEIASVQKKVVVPECEFDRPMTAKEKAEFLKEREHKLKKEQNTSSGSGQLYEKNIKGKIPKVNKPKLGRHSSPVSCEPSSQMAKSKVSTDSTPVSKQRIPKMNKDLPNRLVSDSKEDRKPVVAQKRVHNGSVRDSDSYSESKLVKSDKLESLPLREGNNNTDRKSSKCDNRKPSSVSGSKSGDHRSDRGVSKGTKPSPPSPSRSKPARPGQDSRVPSKSSAKPKKCLKTVNMFEVEDSVTPNKEQEAQEPTVKKPRLSAESLEKLKARSGLLPPKGGRTVDTPKKTTDVPQGPTMSKNNEVVATEKNKIGAVKFSDNVRLNSLPPHLKGKQIPTGIQRALARDFGPPYPGPPYTSRNPKQFKKPPPKRARIESDDEYDSEMDDFIDDGPVGEQEDVSKYIKEIFGYDRRKYLNDYVDDDECMEANYHDVMKEEFKSTKAGILEDLAEARRKKMLKQKKIARVK